MNIGIRGIVNHEDIPVDHKVVFVYPFRQGFFSPESNTRQILGPRLMMCSLLCYSIKNLSDMPGSGMLHSVFVFSNNRTVSTG